MGILDNKYKRYLKIAIPNKLDNLELELNNINVLTGYNDAGKTYILKVIYTFFRVKDFIKRFEDNRVPSIKAIQSFEDIKEKDMVEFYRNNKETINNIEEFKSSFITHTLITYSNLLVKGILGEDKYSFDYMDREYNLSINQDLIKYSSLQETNFVLCTGTKVLEYSNVLLAMPSKASVTGFNNPVSVPDYDMHLVDSLNKYYIDQYDKLDIRFDEEGNCEIKNKGKYVKVSALGDGLKLRAILNTLQDNKTLDDTSILLLDEPDNGLHTSTYLNNIEKMLEFNTVFMTLHNYTFINQIDTLSENVRFFYCKTDEEGIVTLEENSGFEASIKLRDILVGGDDTIEYM
ncbi:MAG: hypothetical protein ACRC6T_08340 [Sarcina sp.]